MRLTDKNKCGDYIISRELCIVKKTALRVADEITNKLGPLEDLEEKLGIDLIILFTALDNGLYLKREYDNIIYFAKPKDIIRCDIAKKYIEIDNFSELGTSIPNDFLDFEDYGKSWSLTKEELENE